MNEQSRLEAQQRADEIRVFQRELNRLTNERVLKLSESQHLAVSEHHNDLLANYTAPSISMLTSKPSSFR